MGGMGNIGEQIYRPADCQQQETCIIVGRDGTDFGSEWIYLQFYFNIFCNDSLTKKVRN